MKKPMMMLMVNIVMIIGGLWYPHILEKDFILFPFLSLHTHFGVESPASVRPSSSSSSSSSLLSYPSANKPQ
uniref:Uncharacterized protein n=1 Tax=Caenorhabditis japonica TaxID=281687 RepID=A0A8R1EGN3_CAEJA